MVNIMTDIANFHFPFRRNEALHISFNFPFLDSDANSGTGRQIHDAGAGATIKFGRPLP